MRFKGHVLNARLGWSVELGGKVIHILIHKLSTGYPQVIHNFSL
jgi:hypothetical protein